MAEIKAARQNNAVHDGAVVNQQKDNTPYLMTDPAYINQNQEVTGLLKDMSHILPVDLSDWDPAAPLPSSYPFSLIEPSSQEDPLNLETDESDNQFSQPEHGIHLLQDNQTQGAVGGSALSLKQR